jgi:hypothetical protein
MASEENIWASTRVQNTNPSGDKHRGVTEHAASTPNATPIADVAYLSGLIDVEWIFYEANSPRRHSTLWEARYLNGVAHLSKRLDDSVQHTEFTVTPSGAQLANGVLLSAPHTVTTGD